MEKGIESLKAAVMKDCAKYQNCFNENGCDHEFTRMEPETNPRIIAMGITQCCRAVSKCSHKYCDKYKWVLDRAQHYADKTGKTRDEILKIWEEGRDYWYMNYYQDCNQPEIEGENVIFYEAWKAELIDRFGEDPKKWAFVCPSCKETQTVQDFIDNKVENPESRVYFSCIGRYIKSRGCDWTLGGLLQINKTTVIHGCSAHPVFEMAPKKL